MPRRPSPRAASPNSQDRPRERLDALGPEALSDAELLALLLRTGGRGVDALALASRSSPPPNPHIARSVAMFPRQCTARFRSDKTGTYHLAKPLVSLMNYRKNQLPS